MPLIETSTSVVQQRFLLYTEIQSFWSTTKPRMEQKSANEVLRCTLEILSREKACVHVSIGAKEKRKKRTMSPFPVAIDAICNVVRKREQEGLVPVIINREISRILFALEDGLEGEGGLIDFYITSDAW